MGKNCCATVERLKRICMKALDKGQYEKTLAAVSAAASLMYAYNQEYTDDVLETVVKQVSRKLLGETSSLCQKDSPNNEKTVLFYDGFGLDTRGLALIYLKGLVRCGYHVVYVTVDSAIGKQPEIEKAVAGYDMQWVFVPNSKNYSAWIHGIANAFDTYKPHTAFFYTTPWDVAAAVTFAHYEGVVCRYQIDLTDHAFWLGKCAFDYCVALRDVGSRIACNYRGIKEESLRMLPYYATIDYDAPFMGFPFSTEDRVVIFSGGALYKTLGDGENAYYYMVDAILKKHQDVIFLYAGTGDDSELKKIIERYPGRAYHIPERKDLYQVLKHSVLYLNTYPMFGGLMMNYAASAGRLPLTLKHYHDADGLLFDQSNLGIEYETKEALVEDVDRLLSDSVYRQDRESRLTGSVISQDWFEKNLKQLIDTKSTEFTVCVDPIDTSAFRKEYVKRFDYRKAIQDAVITPCTRPLVCAFPMQFAAYYSKRIVQKILYMMGRNKND